MSKKTKIINWMKVHKTELIIGGVTVLVETILVAKNWDSIKGLFNAKASIVPDSVTIEPVAEEIIAPIISSDILDNLTGNKLTARALGGKVWCTAQEINKRIVAAGLAEKLPCGDYRLTEAGSKLGNITYKTTAAGHSFTNIEWDEIILEMLFTQEELRDIAVKQERVKQISAA